MHDEGYTRSPAEVLKSDPLRFAPPPGRWTLWHGPQARALVELAQAQGEPARQVPANAPPLPPGFPTPTEPPHGVWLLPRGELRYLIRSESRGGYLSCYLCALP